jgi:hypothetical protein
MQPCKFFQKIFFAKIKIRPQNSAQQGSPAQSRREIYCFMNFTRKSPPGPDKHTI